MTAQLTKADYRRLLSLLRRIEKDLEERGEFRKLLKGHEFREVEGSPLGPSPVQSESLPGPDDSRRSSEGSPHNSEAKVRNNDKRS